MQHDPPRCTPEGSQPKYIMFPSATSNGLREFSECSRESIGQTLDVRSSLCFIQSTYTACWVILFSVCVYLYCKTCVIRSHNNMISLLRLESSQMSPLSAIHS